VNPAGLLFLGGPGFNYIHERSISRGQVLDGVYLGSSFFDAFALGLTLEWMRGTTIPNYRHTEWTFALGGELASLGTSLNIYDSSQSVGLNHQTSWDLGLTLRPCRQASLGVSILNVEQPTQLGVTLPRKFDFGLALRPLWMAPERLTVGVDYLFNSLAGAGAGALQVMAKGEVLRGVSLSGGLSYSFAAAHDLLFQLALTLDTPHVGLTYAVGFAPGGTDHVIDVRLSRAKYSGIAPFGGTYAVFDVDKELGEGGGALALLGATEENPYLRFSRKLARAARDPDLRTVVLKLDGASLGLGKAADLRRTVLDLRQRGKRVTALLYNVGDAEYFLASAADQIVAVPQAMLFLNGFEADLTFLGDTMSKLGVHWDVVRVGKYKNAPDALTRSSASPEQKEATSGVLATADRAYQAAVTGSRGLTPESFRESLALGILTPERAKERGLIDQVLTQREVEKALSEARPHAFEENDFEPNREWGQRRRIAVVPVMGDIATGKSRQEGLGAITVAGAESVVRALREAEEDSRVVAIVLRVDSGGGDAMASDQIYRAVMAAKAKKPVIASMGDTAASGGYYVAMGADTIYALPTTVTGSIGVFVLKPAFQELAQKLGVHQEFLSTAPMSGLFNLYRPWTADERKAVQVWVDSFYDTFISLVAERRGLSKERVDAIARGRVWSGEDAQARGLVDAMGGLGEALAEARRRAHVGEHEALDTATYSGGEGFFEANISGDRAGFNLRLSRARSPAEEALEALAKRLGVGSTWLLEPGLKARMPFELHVQ
jgi:protease-4